MKKLKKDLGIHRSKFMLLIAIISLSLTDHEGIRNDFILNNLSLQIIEVFAKFSFDCDVIGEDECYWRNYRLLNLFLYNKSEFIPKIHVTKDSIYDYKKQKFFRLYEWEIGSEFQQENACSNSDSLKLNTVTSFPISPFHISDLITRKSNNFEIIRNGTCYYDGEKVILVSGYMKLGNIDNCFKNLYIDSTEIKRYIRIKYKNYKPAEILIKSMAANTFEVEFSSAICESRYRLTKSNFSKDRLKLLYNDPLYKTYSFHEIDFYLYSGMISKIDSVNCIWDDSIKRVSLTPDNYYLFK